MLYLIPMAGKATRFPSNKYKFKPLIEVEGRTLMEYAIRSLPLRTEDHLILVLRKNADVRSIQMIMESLKVPCPWEIRIISFETKGQAETAFQVLKDYSDEKVFIHNCDTAMLIGEVNLSQEWDGLLLLFESTEPRFSYAKVESSGLVTETAEKVVISSLASTGSYLFRSPSTFREAYLGHNYSAQEKFIAPLYNNMIRQKMLVRSHVVAGVFSLGTPQDIAENRTRIKSDWIPQW